MSDDFLWIKIRQGLQIGVLSEEEVLECLAKLSMLELGQQINHELHGEGGNPQIVRLIVEVLAPREDLSVDELRCYLEVTHQKIRGGEEEEWKNVEKAIIEALRMEHRKELVTEYYRL